MAIKMDGFIFKRFYSFRKFDHSVEFVSVFFIFFFN